MWITISILVVAAIFFMCGKVRSDLVAVCSLLMLLIFHILTPEEGLSGFSNSVVIMMIGLFVVGGAIFQTGLAKMISSRLLKLSGHSELRLFLLVMLATAFIGAFVSNTGTVALMLPIVVSMAASTGTMMTLIGTPPNLIIQDALTGAGYEPLSFFSFLPVGLICLGVGILVLLPATKWFLGVKNAKGGEKAAVNKSLKELAHEYELTDNLFRLRVEPLSVAVGKTIAGLDLRRAYGIDILEIRRTKSSQARLLHSVTQLSAPDTILEEGDMLYVIGDDERVKRLASDLSLSMPDTMGAKTGGRQDDLAFYDVGIAEIVLMPSSRMINRTVKDVDFRRTFHVNVLGIRRKKEYIRRHLGSEKMHSGDVLLVQGRWEDIGRLSSDEDNWVVLGQPLAEAAKVTLDYKAPIAAAIMVLMVAMMVFDFIPVAPVTAVMIAAVLMVLTGCLRSVEAAYKTINWETIVLFGAMLPMSLALEKTGVSQYLADALAKSIGGYGPTVLLAGVYFTTSLMTMFISNTVTAVLMAPIALQSAVQASVSPVPFLFAVTVAASMCFASPFSTPPNALVMPAGQYSFADYIKVGLPLQVIMGLVMIAALPLLFPF